MLNEASQLQLSLFHQLCFKLIRTKEAGFVPLLRSNSQEPEGKKGFSS
jgi:hypothetical protein